MSKMSSKKKRERECKAAESLIAEYKYELIFDIPFKELEFTGCHAKSSVNIVPTS